MCIIIIMCKDKFFVVCSKCVLNAISGQKFKKNSSFFCNLFSLEMEDYNLNNEYYF